MYGIRAAKQAARQPAERRSPLTSAPIEFPLSARLSNTAERFRASDWIRGAILKSSSIWAKFQFSRHGFSRVLFPSISVMRVFVSLSIYQFMCHSGCMDRLRDSGFRVPPSSRQRRVRGAFALSRCISCSGPRIISRRIRNARVQAVLGP